MHIFDPKAKQIHYNTFDNNQYLIYVKYCVCCRNQLDLHQIRITYIHMYIKIQSTNLTYAKYK